MKRRDPTFYYILAFAALVVVLAFLQSGGGSQPKVGAPAPELRVRTLDGDELRLADLRGNVVLIDFWARWCEPCVELMPALDSLRQRMQGKPFRLLSVNIERTAAAEIKAWLERKRLDLPAAQDPSGAAQAAYQVRSIPKLVLVSPDGVVRRVYSSASEGRLVRDVEELLSGSGSPPA